MKQKHIIALCAVTTIAVLGAVAGTGAYLTHQTPQTVNTFAVGQLEAELTEPEWDKLPDEAKVLYPGKTVAKDPTACNAAESTTAAYMYLQVEIPRASVRTYTIAETAKADGSDETNQEPTSGAGVLDNGGEPHTVDLVSFQPNDGWSLLEETETEETHTFIYQKYYEHCFACAVAALGGVDRRLGRHIVLHVCVSLSASTHRRLPRQNAARLSARFRLLPVRDAVFIGTYARPGCFRVYRGIFLPVNRTVRPCQSPGTAPERERTESTSAAHLHSAADCGRPYGSSFIFPPRLGCLYSVRCFCGCVITCNLVARLWCTIALYYQTLGEKT